MHFDAIDIAVFGLGAAAVLWIVGSIAGWIADTFGDGHA